MSAETRLKEDVLRHLMTEREEVALTCERCNGRWEIAGPFEPVVAFACPTCGLAGSISLVRQVEKMVSGVLAQLEDRLTEQYMARAERRGVGLPAK